MPSNYSARQRLLSMSECQRLCGGRSSSYVEELARWSGVSVLMGQTFAVDVGRALHMVAIAEASDAGFEYATLSRYLPGLRQGALMKLGLSYDTWFVDGDAKQQSDFFYELRGGGESAKAFVASVLGCCRADVRRELRIYSQDDVEFLTDAEALGGRNGRTPRLVLDAHRLADRVQAVSGSRLFTATPTVSNY